MYLEFELIFYGQAERRMPGLSYDLVRHLLVRAELAEKTDLCQTLLRLGGQTETEGECVSVTEGSVVVAFPC